MKRAFLLLVLFMAIFTILPGAGAAEFNWLPELNVKAEADPAGFKASLAARFNLDAIKVEAVIKSVEKPADAYMVLKLGEMSKRPPEYVLQQYKTNKGQGWGVMAKSLGIKPGSPEFHALKKGHDLYRGAPADSKGKGKKRK